MNKEQDCQGYCGNCGCNEHPEDHINGSGIADKEECCGGHCGCHEQETSKEIVDSGEVLSTAGLTTKLTEAKDDEQLKARMFKVYPVVSKPHFMGHKVGRNDPCICGSGKKYKMCCLPKE